MTDLYNQKRLAAKVASVGIGKISLDASRIDDIKEAITKADIRSLIKQGAIKIHYPKTPSRHRARKRKLQRKKGRRRGEGKKKGKFGARVPKKREWINKIRLLRKTLRTMRDKEQLGMKNYKMLYAKAKGGFFRNRAHMIFYIKQNNLFRGAKKQ